MKTRLTALLLSLLALLLSGAASAATDLPAAGKVIERFIEATGGQEAHRAHETLTAVGKFSMPAMGIEADIEMWQKAPDQMRTNITSPMFGTMTEGYDGEVAFESSMMTGSKIKDGVELALARRTAQFNPWLDWADWYRSATTLGSETIDGQECWVVEMIPNEGEGEPEKYWFAKESGLLVKTASTIVSEMGTVSMEGFPGDYRQVGDVKLPFETRQVLMGAQEIVITFSEQVFDAEIPADTFDLPDEVKALLQEGE